MPFILSPLIGLESPGMWAEGHAYQKRTLYSIESGKLPPVNYDEHILRVHSLTHLETPAHTQAEGQRLDFYFQKMSSSFYGKTLVLRLSGNHYKSLGNGLFHWEISVDGIKERMRALGVVTLPGKVLITSDEHPVNEQGYHDPNYVLTLSQAAADFLCSFSEFHLYGTSWKSSDFKPGSTERPIHNTLFRKGPILENLSLIGVPEGIYFLSAFPIPLQGASEAPVVPVLFTRDELLKEFL